MASAVRAKSFPSARARSWCISHCQHVCQSSLPACPLAPDDLPAASADARERTPVVPVRGPPTPHGQPFAAHS
eukprot:8866113-Pyramimonas_sp.AAC.1